MSTFNPAVTATRSFCVPDGQALFYVHAGVPVEQAMEHASSLLACLEVLSQQHGALNESVERVLTQSVTEMTRALIDACQPQDPEMLQQGLRMAAKARADLLARVSPQTAPKEE